MSGRTCRATSSNTQVRTVTSSIHQGRPCQPCILCKASNFSKYFHPKSWKDKSLLENLRKYEPFVDIQLDSCICRLCRDDVSRICNETFVPRWKRCTNNSKCYIHGCKNAVHRVTKVATRTEVCDFFGMPIIAMTALGHLFVMNTMV